MTFSDQLRALRARKNFSQAQAAATLPGLSVRTLQDWELGRSTPPEWAQSMILTHLKKKRAKTKRFNKCKGCGCRVSPESDYCLECLCEEDVP